MRAALVLSVVLAACSSTAVSPTTADVPVHDAAVEAAAPDVAPALCVPGAQSACACVGGAAGAQLCASDGRALGPCECPDAGGPMDAGPPPDAPVDDVLVASDPDAAARSYDYVINRLALDMGGEAPGSRAFYGFNLDGRHSPSAIASQERADCRHGDYFSVVDRDQNRGECAEGAEAGGPTCRGGVDNQLPNVVRLIQQLQPSLSVEGTLNASINAGRSLWIVRVSGVNGALGPSLTDPAVTVLFYEHAAAMFADCANVATPGQTYAIDDRSLTTAGDLSSARLQFSGSIVNGRLRVAPATMARLGLPITIMGAAIDLALTHTQLRFDLGEAEGARGNLGGYMPQTELVDAFTSIPALRMYRDVAAPLIQGFVDVATGSPMASCDSPNGAIGAGLGFSAVRAVVAAETVTATPAGMCGARP